MVVVVLGRRDALSVRKFEEVNLPNAFYGNKMKWRGGIEEDKGGGPTQLCGNELTDVCRSEWIISGYCH